MDIKKKLTFWVKRKIAFILNIFRITSFSLNKFSGKSDVVLMYHRIIFTEKNELIEPGMYVTPTNFEMHLQVAQKYMISKTLKNIYQSKPFHWQEERRKPAFTLTFDDGWKDFYQYVFPILIKYSTPATVFLPTSFISTKKIFWTDRVMTIFSKSQDTEFCKKDNMENLSTIPKHVINLTSVESTTCSVVIDYLKLYKHSVINSVLDELEEFMGIDLKKQKRTFLNWEEVREMKESGLVQFGSHTHNHAILTTLERSEVRYELEKSREILCAHGVVDPDFIPFCYPNGNFTDAIAIMVKNAGYSLAVTTRRGWNETNSEMFSLNRVGLHNDISYTPSLFLSRVAGLL